MADYDVVQIGGGHNGLVAATRLARAGATVLVVERRETVGGAAVTGEICPGYRCSTLAHVAQPAAVVVEELALARHGLELIRPDPWLVAPRADGRALVLHRDSEATADRLAAFSAADARAYPGFRATMSRLAGFIGRVLAGPPPDLEGSSVRDLWALLTLGSGLRGLGRKDGSRLLRWAPMPVADFVSEWFESEPLRAALAGSGVFGTSFGPRSAGSTAVLLLQQATGDGMPCLVGGGLGGFTTALASAAREAGVAIRTGAGVARIRVDRVGARAVVLAGGEEIAARAIVSNLDPRRTFLDLLDPADLDEAFLGRIRHYRSRGTVFKLNLALRGLPEFPALARAHMPGALGGRIHIGPDIDYLERAFDASKYGACSTQPYLDVTLPSVTDPALAPSGHHVMSICAQFAPYALRAAEWRDAGPAFADRVIDTFAEYAPDLRDLIVGRQIVTPRDLETEYGLTGGHIFHGELALDQLFTMRPVLGWARYRTPVRNLYLCGSGTHPGYGVSGLSGWNAARAVIRDLR